MLANLYQFCLIHTDPCDNSIQDQLVLDNSCNVQFHSRFNDYRGYHSGTLQTISKYQWFFIYLWWHKQHKNEKVVMHKQILLLGYKYPFHQHPFAWTWIDFKIHIAHFTIKLHDF